MKLFMVTTGSYSDYEIRGIYSTREKAENACNPFGEKCFENVENVGQLNVCFGMTSVHLWNDLNIREIKVDSVDNIFENEYGFDPEDEYAVKVYFSKIILNNGMILSRDEIPERIFEALVIPKSIDGRVPYARYYKEKINGETLNFFSCYSSVSQEHADKVCIEKYQNFLRKEALGLVEGEDLSSSSETSEEETSTEETEE